MAAPRGSARSVRSGAQRRVREALRRLPDRLRDLARPAPPAPVAPAGASAGAPAAHSYPPLVAELRHLGWDAAGDLQLEGWTYLSTAPGRRGEVKLWAQVLGGDQVVPALVTQQTSLEPNAFTKVSDDLSHSAWTATFPAAGWASIVGGDPAARARAALGPTTIRLQVWVELTVGGTVHRSPMTKTYRWGSASGLPGRLLGRDWWLAGHWRGADGLVLEVRSDAVVADEVTLDADRVEIRVRALGAAAPTTVLLSAGAADPQPFRGAEPGRVRLSAGELPARDGADLIWIATDGSRHRVLAESPALVLSHAPRMGLAVSASPEGGVLLARRGRLALATAMAITPGSEPALVVSGALAGVWSAPLRLELRGPRDTVSVLLDPVGGAFEAALALLRADAWGNAGLALQPGGYRLWLVDGTGRDELVELGAGLVASLYVWTFGERFSARLEHHPDGGGLWLVVLDPRPLAEIGAYARKQLRARHQRGATVAEIEDAVYFESFVGESCADSPKAVFDELGRRNLGLHLYWGVRDRSVPVPDGATPVVINSAEWWRVRHQARYLVTNDWLHDTFKHRPHQRVLQTWHGTAFKLLALDRPRARDDAAFLQAIQNENAKWDLLLAENAYSVEMMRRAYAYEGVVLESGYPRNDILTSPRATAVREELRSRMGIRADQQVVLYAPTWREDRTTMVTDLDLAGLASTLGEEYVILARGHAKTLRGAPGVGSPGVVDVSTYPEVADLFCTADVAVTDYSSVMFDFAVTGKPLLFFTPDYDAYVRARGVYFDLAGSAPGPMLTTLVETAEAIVDRVQIREQWDDRYRAWTERFTAWEDGQASVRATDALLAP